MRLIEFNDLGFLMARYRGRIMARDMIEDLVDAIRSIAQNTGYLTRREMGTIVAKRLILWALVAGAVGGMVSMLGGYSPSLFDMQVYMPGGVGAIILALAPLRQDINSLHQASGSPDGIKKDRMPAPVIRDLKRATDRTSSLVLVAATFFQQLLLL